MANRERRPPSRSTRRRSRRAVSPWRNPKVWLATLSTVVGIATGMFTLRDQVFPSEAGSAGAADEHAYRSHIGEICDELNAAEAARRRDDRELAKQLPRARTNLAQRDALLDAARRSVARSSHALAEFGGLRPPEADARTQHETVRVWEHSVARIQGYVERLDRADGRPGLMAAVDRLSRDRPVLARDGLAVNTGLARLGMNRCVIDPPVVTKTVSLPPDPQARRRSPRHRDERPSPSVNPPSTSPRPTPQATSTPVPSRITAAPAHPRVNTPSNPGPVGGGSEDG
jgi:hypothetical protein